MLDQRKHAIQVHRNRAMPLFIGQAIDRRILGRPDAMIGDQNVQTSEGRDGGRDQLPGGIHGRKIALHRATIGRATFPHQILGLRLCRLVIEDNFRARSRQTSAPQPRLFRAIRR